MPRPSALLLRHAVPIWSSPDRGGMRGPSGHRAPGRNFAALDPLLLSRDLVSARLSADPDPAALLTERLARFLSMPAVLSFASGAMAIRHVLPALLDPTDEVIIDAGADPAMFETVRHAEARLHRSPPGSLDAVERRLQRLARQPRTGRLFVMLPAIARLTSVAADLADFCTLCAAHGAILVVDASQDLGMIGQAGQGLAEVQGCLAGIDVILGDMAGTFAVPGGFAAFRDPALADRVRAHPLRALPLAPAFAAMTLAALALVASPEGARRRRLLHGNALRLRNHLMADGLRVLGHPSPVVPVLLPPRKAEAHSALLRSAGVTVPLLQAPMVAGHAPRWHVRLNAGHRPADIDDLADLMRDVIRAVGRPAKAPLRSDAPVQPGGTDLTDAVT